MRKYFWKSLVPFVFLLSACGPKTVEVVTDRFPDGKPKNVKLYKVDGKDSTLLRETTYYQNGQKYMEGWYRNGQRDSVWTAWLNDGRIWSKGSYREGKEDGLKEVYHQNGQLFYRGYYNNGQRTGEWKFYNDRGDLLQVINYDAINSDSSMSPESSAGKF
ncbi:MAG: toxin-antitoxin system YwqK family antitoxin [Bacteroidales bacterium]